MLRIHHIVNPVALGPSSDLYLAQPITFASMQRAREAARDIVDVRLHAVCYAEDVSMLGNHFDTHRVIEQSVLDTGTFLKQRKLPMLKDLLDPSDHEQADYIVYTNVDIALMPWFYTIIAKRVEQGHDAFIINRRTIATEPSLPTELEAMYAQVGELHPGLDCFVFSKDILHQMVLAQTCIGVTFIGKVLELNLMALSKKYMLYKYDHLTFHLGDDRSWRNPDLDDYMEHNKQQLSQVIDELTEHADPKTLEYIKQYRYDIFDWNGDGLNPKFQVVERPSIPVSERIKRSIGALLGKY